MFYEVSDIFNLVAQLLDFEDIFLGLERTCKGLYASSTNVVYVYVVWQEKLFTRFPKASITEMNKRKLTHSQFCLFLTLHP